MPPEQWPVLRSKKWPLTASTAPSTKLFLEGDAREQGTPGQTTDDTCKGLLDGSFADEIAFLNQGHQCQHSIKETSRCKVQTTPHDVIVSGSINIGEVQN
jgi:hypothetical protein